MRIVPKKTPKDVTEFEREQLRFFFTKYGAGAILAELNPSLAWLPMLAELNLIDNGTRLVSWIQKNFADADAIREVAANIRYFERDAADNLELSLNNAKNLPLLFVTCWRLIIRHMKTMQRGALRDEWFDIVPRIRGGEQSSELLERLAEVLRPKVRVRRHHSWYDEDARLEPAWPKDLISIDFEIDDGVNDEEILSAWPEDASSEIDHKLLNHLTNVLDAALAEAIEAGVESDLGYGVTDADVRSVAKHEQNTNNAGFLAIARVMADLWIRLSRKDAHGALAFLERWRTSVFRLMRRLAVFAATDNTVPPELAAQVLSTLPPGELFLTNASVEVYRLIDTRWADFTVDQRRDLEKRFAEGPPGGWFRRDVPEMINRCRFDLLGQLERNGARLGDYAKVVLNEIRVKWPEWELRPKDQAGFHIWHETSNGVVGNIEKLNGVSDEQLVNAATSVANSADIREGDVWETLCQTDAPRALRVLAAQAVVNQWPETAWSRFLWTSPKGLDFENVSRVGQLLLDCPMENFIKIAIDTSWWLKEMTTTLDENLLWPLWDRIFETTSQKKSDALDG
jgi:hypothetical protein